MNYLPRQFFSFRGRGSGTLLYRGYTPAQSAKATASGSRSASHSRRPSTASQRPEKPEPPAGSRPRAGSVFDDVKEGAEKLKQEGVERLSSKDKKSALQEEMAPVVRLHLLVIPIGESNANVV